MYRERERETSITRMEKGGILAYSFMLFYVLAGLSSTMDYLQRRPQLHKNILYHSIVVCSFA